MAGASDYYSPAYKALQLRRQLLNVRTAKYFAVAIAALMGLFIVYHWTRFLYHRCAPKQKGPVTKTVVGWQRLAAILFDQIHMLT